MSRLLQIIKNQRRWAKESKATMTHNILTVIVMNMQGTGRPIDDDLVIKTIRELIRSNEVAIEVCEATKPSAATPIQLQNAILKGLLTNVWGWKAITNEIMFDLTVAYEVIDAKSHVKAISYVAKRLRDRGVVFEGKELAKAVITFRGGQWPVAARSLK